VAALEPPAGGPGVAWPAPAPAADPDAPSPERWAAWFADCGVPANVVATACTTPPCVAAFVPEPGATAADVEERLASCGSVPEAPSELGAIVVTAWPVRCPDGTEQTMDLAAVPQELREVGFELLPAEWQEDPGMVDYVYGLGAFGVRADELAAGWRCGD
jgi:hypothetical protein